MRVLFLAVKDLEKVKYFREGRKNLLRTNFGKGDTIALCGKLIKAEKTNYGPRLWIDDGKKIGIVVGTFNEGVRKDAEGILEKFNRFKGLYLLVYGNPYYKDKLYINVNQDNGVIVVKEETYQKFRQLRKRNEEYLKRGGEKAERGIGEKKEITYEDIFKFLKKNGGEGTIEEIEVYFLGIDKKVIYEKILELLESGRAYEPKPELIKLLD